MKANPLTAQELHELGIKWVYKHIKNDYEILSVNMEFDKNPQILARKDDKMHFIVVKTSTYPDVGSIPAQAAEEIIKHAEKHEAKCLFAHVGVANANGKDEQEMARPVKNGEFYINYKGLTHLPNTL